VTYGQVEEVAQPALIDTENEFDLKFDPSPAVPNEIDATDVAENEATAAPQVWWPYVASESTILTLGHLFFS
jgi:hypothetical protein